MSIEKSLAAACSCGRETVPSGECSRCGATICDECARPADEEQRICTPCSYRETVAAVGQDIRGKEAAALEGNVPEMDGPGPVRKAIAGAVLAIVVVGLALVWGPTISESAAKTEPYALGPVGDDAPGLADCIGALWQVRGAFDEWVYRHEGKLPRTLGQVEGIPTGCPGCGKAWTYERTEGGGYRIACPEPSAHERTGVFLTDRHGPPRVTLGAEAGR